MPPKKKPIDPAVVETIWAAGFVSGGGSLKLVNAGKTRVVRYVITSNAYPEAIDRLAKFTGSTIYSIDQAGKKASRISVQGAALHAFLTRIWEYLTIERKRQYAEMRSQITSTVEGPNPYHDNAETKDL